MGRDARALNRYNGMHKVKLRNGKRKGSEGEVRAVARCCREQMQQAPGAARLGVMKLRQRSVCDMMVGHFLPTYTIALFFILVLQPASREGLGFIAANLQAHILRHLSVRPPVLRQSPRLTVHSTSRVDKAGATQLPVPARCDKALLPLLSAAELSDRCS